MFYDDPGELTPVAGVGDKAYFQNTKETPMHTFHTVQGDAYVNLHGPGSLAPNRRLDLQGLVAKNALQRLDK